MRLPETLRTERLALRAFLPEDAPAVFAYSQDADWAEFQQTTPTSLREAERVGLKINLDADLDVGDEGESEGDPPDRATGNRN